MSYPGSTMRPADALIVPALVVLGDVIYFRFGGPAERGLSGLGAGIFFFFMLVPASLIFLAIYAATILQLRRAPRPRGTLAIISISTLAGLAALAAGAGVGFVLLTLEAMLSR